MVSFRQRNKYRPRRDHQPRTCDHTGKVRYRSQRAAENAITYIHDFAGDRTYIPVRAYQCPHCDQWHLTSKPE